MKEKPKDLVIIGGGIMGLMTAYFASNFTKNITIIEKRTIGPENKEAASFSYTRSMRTDYLDSLYSRLAFESQSLWQEIQRQFGKQLFVDCGCLNLAKQSVTPEFTETYGAKSYEVIKELNFAPEKYDLVGLRQRFPQFSADIGFLDKKAGYMDVRATTTLLLKVLRERGVEIVENTSPQEIAEDENGVRIVTEADLFVAKKLVVTVGGWTNDILKIIASNTLSVPLTFDKPKECKYFFPAEKDREQFLPQNFPVFAYLDVGIYGHPIFDESKGAVKISYYNPTDVETKPNEKITSVADFVAECLPALQDVRSEDVTDADQCSYDLVEDDNFVLGTLPGSNSIFLGTGWRGTGYKFAPLVGKALTQLALQNGTVYDIKQFNPERFLKDGTK